MAIREIFKKDDELLRKRSKEIEKIDNRVLTLLDDLKDTLKNSGNGIGIAAPQVGVLKRAIVIDVGDGPIEIINPKITTKTGMVCDVEGCLSVPGVYGEVNRPKSVVVIGQDRNGNEIKIDGEDLVARVLCHEIDHLDGVLFIDKVLKYIDAEAKK